MQYPEEVGRVEELPGLTEPNERDVTAVGLPEQLLVSSREVTELTVTEEEMFST